MKVEYLIPDKQMNRVISRTNEAQAAVAALASQIAGRARANLAAHFYSGASSISVTHGRVDSYVNLNDEAATSIEYGHFVGGKYTNDGSPRYVEPLYILARAAGLI